MLDGIEVRTLVNSHLTFFAEQGWFVGCAWIAFVIVALAGGWRRHPRLWIAFAGLSLSACASSVFDWHVLFGFAEKGGLGALNFTLSWALFAAFLAMGAVLAVADDGASAAGQSQTAGGAAGRGTGALAGRLLAALACVLVLLALRPFVPISDVPKVRDGFMVKEGRDMPLVLHDGSWPLKAVAGYFDGGYRIAIAPGYAAPDAPPKFVWLFGSVAESAHRFPSAMITVVDPPEFCDLPPNAVRMR